MNRKNFFKNSIGAAVATFWGSKLEAIVPMPDEEPAFKFEMPKRVVMPMSSYQVGDVFLHGYVENKKLIGETYRVMNGEWAQLVTNDFTWKIKRLDSFNPERVHKLYSQIQEKA